jgi:hypothetical protein
MVRVHGVSKWSVVLVEVGQWPVATSRMHASHCATHACTPCHCTGRCTGGCGGVWLWLVWQSGMRLWWRWVSGFKHACGSLRHACKSLRVTSACPWAIAINPGVGGPHVRSRSVLAGKEWPESVCDGTCWTTSETLPNARWPPAYMGASLREAVHSAALWMECGPTAFALSQIIQ